MIGYPSSINNGKRHFSLIYITYTLLMQAQEALNEDALVDGQDPEVGDDLNDSDVENQAPINHIEDYMMDKNKEFDDELLDEDYISRSDAYKMLSIQSTKKYKANITRQFHKSRSAKRTHVVCVTDKDAPSLAHCKCSYRAVIKRKRGKDDKTYYIEKEGRNLKHSEGCLRNSANCPGNTTVRSNLMQHVEALHPEMEVHTSTVSKFVQEGTHGRK